MQLLFAIYTSWIVIVTLMQLCIILFLLRIFWVFPMFRYLAWVLVVAITSLGIAGFLVLVFQCYPIRKAWMPTEPGSCINTNAACQSVGLLHVIFDLCILILPMPVIWNLRTANRDKATITLMFGLGVM
jgi:hypothetical protein